MISGKYDGDLCAIYVRLDIALSFAYAAEKSFENERKQRDELMKVTVKFHTLC